MAENIISDLLGQPGIRNALLSVAFELLRTPKRQTLAQSIGRAGLVGLQALQQSEQQQAIQEFRKAQLQDKLSKVAELEEEKKSKDEFRKALQGLPLEGETPDLLKQALKRVTAAEGFDPDVALKLLEGVSRVENKSEKSKRFERILRGEQIETSVFDPETGELGPPIAVAPRFKGSGGGGGGGGGGGRPRDALKQAMTSLRAIESARKLHNSLFPIDSITGDRLDPATGDTAPTFQEFSQTLRQKGIAIPEAIESPVPKAPAVPPSLTPGFTKEQEIERIRSLFKSGAIPREEATRRLQALGLR